MQGEGKRGRTGKHMHVYAGMSSLMGEMMRDAGRGEAGHGEHGTPTQAYLNGELSGGSDDEDPGDPDTARSEQQPLQDRQEEKQQSSLQW